MRRFILLIAVVFMFAGMIPNNSFAEQIREYSGEISKEEFCQDAGPDSMQQCNEAYKELQRKNIGIPGWLEPVLKECGFMAVKEILELGCIETCIETFGATCVACVFGGKSFYDQSKDCVSALCKAAGGKDYHFEGGKCVKK